MQYDVFISYRRDLGSEIARALKLALENKNIDVFLDIDGLSNGKFDTKLFSHIETTHNFVLILSENAFDRLDEKDDWLYQEINYAIQKGRNIIPVFSEKFNLRKVKITPQLEEILKFNAVNYSHEYFDAMVLKIINYLNLPNTATKQ